MSYELINWENAPSTKTPINAENLNHMEQGIYEAHEKINNGGFITKTAADLINYYTKSETYTQGEINQLVSTIPKFSIQPVQALPTEDISATTVYLLTTGEESQNLYTEYIYVNGAWEKLGTQKLDLSGYALKTDIPTKLSELINDTEFITAAVDNLVNYYTKKETEERLYEKANSILTTHKGELIQTTDSANVKPKNIRLYGKTEQPQYEGNQLFKPTTPGTSWTGVICTIDENDKCIFNGTYKDSTILTDIGQAFTIPSDGDYTFHVEVENLSSSGWMFQHRGSDNSEKAVIVYHESVTHTVDAVQGDVLCFYMAINAGTTLTNASMQIDINRGTEFLGHEPFTGNEPSPSMIYSQPLHRHGDSGSIVGKVLNKNLFPVGEWGSEIQGNSIIGDIMIPVIANTTYYCSFYAKLVREDIQKQSMRYRYYKEKASAYSEDNTLQIGDIIARITATEQWFTFTFTPTQDCWFGLDYGDTFGGSKYRDIIVSQVDNIYKPYTEQPFTALTPNGFMGLKTAGGNLPYANYTDANGNSYIANEISFEEGKRKERVHEYEISELTFHSVVAYGENGYNEFNYITPKKCLAHDYQSLCTHFKQKYSWRSDDEYFYVSDIYARFYTNKFTTREEFEAWANEQAENGTPLKVTVAFAEPITTDLTEEEMAQYNAIVLNKGNNTLLNDAGAYMELEQVCDTQLHIEQNYTPKEAHTEHENRIAELERVIANL